MIVQYEYIHHTKKGIGPTQLIKITFKERPIPLY